MATNKIRAKHFSKRHNVSYQVALSLLGRNRAQLTRLHDQTQWPMEECEDFLSKHDWDDVVDPELEIGLGWHTRYVGNSPCAECGHPVLYGVDKKGEPTGDHTYCHRCRGRRAPEDLPECARYCGNKVLQADTYCEDCSAQFARYMDRD